MNKEIKRQRRKELGGLKFNMLTVISAHHRNERRELFWECLCDCGNKVVVRSNNIKNGHTKSCGCHQHSQQLKSVLTHGNTANGNRSPEYNAWLCMKDRCNNPNNNEYHNYGGRGIIVCQRWNDSFEFFLEDMGLRPSAKHSLDRFPDNNSNYGPGNTRWATKREQMANVRYNVWYEYKGVKMIVADWSRLLKASNGVIYFHLNKGRSFSWVIEYFLNKNKIQWIGEI